MLADSANGSARADTDGDHWLLEQHKLGLLPSTAVLHGRHRQFRWAIINPTGLNTGSN